MRSRMWAAAGVLALLSSWSYFFPQPPRMGPLARLETVPRRTLVFAPHSDDEVVAAGGLLADLEAQGAQPRVVLVTSGDGFKVGAEIYHRGPVLPERMVEYGRHRLGESRSALARLGLPQERLIFLGFPDGGLHRLWGEYWQPDRLYTSPTTRFNRVPYAEARRVGVPYSGRTLLGELIDILRETRPAVVVYPHPNESHVDHWALSNFVTAALEELRRTEPDWEPPAEWFFLVHRGDWPAPKGYRPTEGLLPPVGLATGMTSWQEHPLNPEQVKRKEEALQDYRSQTMVLKRYLQSFIRTNELFGTIARVKLTGSTEPYPFFPGEKPPWPDLNWVQVITDPRADTVARELERGADALSVWAARNGGMLSLAVPMVSRPRRPVEIRFYVREFHSGQGWGDLASVTVQPEGAHRVDAWPAGTGRDLIRAEQRGSWVTVTLPLPAMGEPESVLINVETRVDNVLLDRTAWRPVSLDGR
ncbi:MAG TPA: PIG-L family deacetylase [Symbiobacteriaceae bacterium]|nr:PIG-L family deacetylase [Symbiobacteriaceae bacterium]